jgi:hypothetical protein
MEKYKAPKEEIQENSLRTKKTQWKKIR